MIPIRTALVSVSDKSGLADFARGLAQFKIKILSTGGTAKLLAGQGLFVTEVADHTGFPEMLDGRVKTLHPKLHAGILARRDSPAHMAAIKAAGGTMTAEPFNYGTTGIVIGIAIDPVGNRIELIQRPAQNR